MRKPLAVIVSVAAALIAACTESTGPPRARSPDLAFAVSSQSIGDHILRHRTTAPALETYQVRFWVVRGQKTTVNVGYVGGGQFLRLEFAAGTLFRRPDGTLFGDGEGVEITLTLDPTRLLFNLEPSGLQFSDESPVRLNLWYQNADPDLNADGQVDGTDDTIRQEYLGVWYQAALGAPWEAQLTDKIPSEKRFRSDLFHFSGYAISW